MKSNLKNRLKRHKKTSGPDSDRTQILELSNKQFKITLINILQAVMEEEDNIQGLIHNVSRKMGTQRKNQRETETL